MLETGDVADDADVDDELGLAGAGARCSDLREVDAVAGMDVVAAPLTSFFRLLIVAKPAGGRAKVCWRKLFGAGWTTWVSPDGLLTALLSFIALSGTTALLPMVAEPAVPAELPLKLER